MGKHMRIGNNNYNMPNKICLSFSVAVMLIVVGLLLGCCCICIAGILRSKKTSGNNNKNRINSRTTATPPPTTTAAEPHEPSAVSSSQLEAIETTQFPRSPLYRPQQLADVYAIPMPRLHRAHELSSAQTTSQASSFRI